MSRFTDVQIKGLKPREKTYFKSEVGGLTLQVHPTGKKVWRYRYSINGVRRWYRLGTYPEVSLAKARTLRDIEAGHVAQRIDPAKVRAQELDEQRKAGTVKELSEQYIRDYAKKKKRSWAEDERNLKKDIIPKWGKKKAREITSDDVNRLVAKIENRLITKDINRGKILIKKGELQPVDSEELPVYAQPRVVFAVISKMYNWGIEETLVGHNPCQLAKKPPSSPARKRDFKESEIKQFWDKLDDCLMPEPIKRGLKLALVTGQRPGEVIGLSRSEIDGSRWLIPPERTKNKQEHFVHLTDIALDLIGDFEGDFVFPLPTKPDKPYDENEVAGSLRKNLHILELDDFRPHDLRGVVTTQMAKMKILGEIRQRVQNHTIQSVSEKHYNTYDFADEKKDALERWAKRLKNILNGKFDW